MRRSVNFQNLLIIGFSGPVLALNVWVLSQIFRYFEHLVTVLTIAALVAFLLNYPVRALERLRIRRFPAIGMTVLTAIAIFVILGVTVVPSAIEQTSQLIQQVPEWLKASNDNVNRWELWGKSKGLPLDLNVLRTQINAKIDTQIQLIASQVLNLAVGTVSGLLDTVLITVLSIYMLVYGGKLWSGLIDLFPKRIGASVGNSLRLNFQNFFISQLLLGGFMASLLTPIFFVLNVPFGLSFAIFIGLSELIPFIGASLGIGIVTLLVMLKSFVLALWVLVVSVILQQIKDNLIAPKLMGDFTGLNPIAIFVCLLIGAQIAGILGAIVSIPIAGTIMDTIDLLRQPPERDATPDREFVGEAVGGE
jgi:predicted PurR-regulated permease PerM